MTTTLSGYPTKLKLLAVTKGKTVEEIDILLRRIKITRIGENRLEEAESKFQKLPTNLEKHFLGKLQSRKIKKIVKLFDVIQSVETLEQAKKISEQKKPIQIFLQVNLSDLVGRSGAHVEEAKALIEQIEKLPFVELIGVMGMATPDLKKARIEFKLLKKIQQETGLPECSMGMSDDYLVALEEGSTLLRLGRVLFQDQLPFLPNFE